MDTIQTENQVTTTETTTGATTESPKVDTTPKTGEGVTPLAATQTEKPEVQAYQPNFKYKAAGKELEFDEWVRPVIKSKEQEEKLREIYAKANGADVVIESREKLNQKFTDLQTQYTQLYNEASQAMNFKAEGDYESFFKMLGIKEQDVLNYFVEKHNLSQLPPEQQKIYNERNAYKHQQREYQNQYSQMEEGYRNLEVKLLNFELNQALQNHEAKEVQGNYDSRYGEGSFKELVRDMALAKFHQTGKDLAPEEAVKLVIQRLGDGYRSKPATGIQSEEKPLPVIPKVGGAAMSPTKKQPRSIDDLRKISQEMM